MTQVLVVAAAVLVGRVEDEVVLGLGAPLLDLGLGDEAREGPLGDQVLAALQVEQAVRAGRQLRALKVDLPGGQGSRLWGQG